MYTLPLTVNSLYKADIEYHGKFGHALRKIQYITLMIIFCICYATSNLSIKTVAPNLTGFQSIKQCVQYLASRPHKPILYHSNYYYGSNVSILT